MSSVAYRIIPFELYKKRLNYQKRDLSGKRGGLELTIAQIERYLKRVDRNGDCWIFITRSNENYPKFDGILAHRVAYELYKGKIPPGLTVDHLCFNRLCQKPQHLEAVTIQENSRRYIDFSRGIVSKKDIHN